MSPPTNTTNTNHQHHQNKNKKEKKKLVVRVRRPKKKAAANAANTATTTTTKRIARNHQRRRAIRRSGAGLPSLPHRTPLGATEEAPAVEPDHHHHNHNEHWGTEEEEEEEWAALPCDTRMAVESLLGEDRGLTVPFLASSSGGRRHAGAVLESQVFGRFEESHASVIAGELRRLAAGGEMVRLPTTTTTPGGVGGGGAAAWMLAGDYAALVRDAHHHYHHEQPRANDDDDKQQQRGARVVEWFLGTLLPAAAGRHPLPGALLREHWPEEEETDGDAQRAIGYLLGIRVLLREAPSPGAGCYDDDDDCFSLWLPNWGVVLGAWEQARQRLLARIARTRGGEVSGANLLRENKHSSFSAKFLLDDLLARGVLKAIDRPSGTFYRKHH